MDSGLIWPHGVSFVQYKALKNIDWLPAFKNLVFRFLPENWEMWCFWDVIPTRNSSQSRISVFLLVRTEAYS